MTVAFRGTSNIMNWLNNFDMLHVDWDGIGVHEGFYDAYMTVRDSLFGQLSKTNKDKIKI